jgi:hypothetical protein
VEASAECYSPTVDVDLKGIDGCGSDDAGELYGKKAV